jgi:hypothetical protein
LLGTWAGVVHEFFKNPLEVGIRICASAADLLDPALRDVDDGAAPAGVFASDEHPVFVAELGGANRVWVLVAQSAPSIKVNMSLFKACGKLGPFRLGVVQRFAQGTPRRRRMSLETYKSPTWNAPEVQLDDGRILVLEYT